MTWLRRLLALFRWRSRRREVDAEIALHRELLADDRKFGNPLRLRERSLEVWGWGWLESLLQDVRHGLRLLARTPVATALALLSLTLGIGANTALFSLTDALLLRPLPVAHPEQLVRFGFRTPNHADFSNPMWEQLRDRQRALDAVFAYAPAIFDLDPGGAETATGMYVSGSYFSSLGVPAERGALLTPADDRRGCPAVADISDRFWRSHFAAAPGAVGATLTLNGHAATVIGVFPAPFLGPQVGWGGDIVVPICQSDALRGFRSLLVANSWWLAVGGRLRPGESASDATAILAAQQQIWKAALPPGMDAQERQDFGLRLSPGGRGSSDLQGSYGESLEILLAVAGFVLLVACANLAGLMLARAAARRQELAVRLALGASRGRLLRQLLTESLLLALGGAAGGAVFAAWACAATEHFLSTAAVGMALHLTPDLRVLAFALGLTLGTALLIGAMPAQSALRGAAEAPRPQSSPAPQGAGWLVAAQLALALLLVSAAGLFLRSFANLTGPAKGFATRGIVLATITAPKGERLPPGLDAKLRAIPGIEALSASMVVPAQGSSRGPGIEAVGGATRSAPDALWNAVTPGFFFELRTPLLLGREFESTDSANSPAVAILNQRLARILFPGTNALGKLIRQTTFQGPGPSAAVVGVVADVKYTALQRAAPAAAYFPVAQQPHPARLLTFYLQTSRGEAGLAADLHRVTEQALPGGRIRVETYDSLQAAGVKPERLLATLSEGFGALALLLAAIGLYGALAYDASRRRREFGVRTALGAEQAAIRRLVLRQAGSRLLAGTAAGLALAWIVGGMAQHGLAKLLYGVQATDAGTLLGAAALLAAVGLAAAWLPARRAARADPMLALREE